MPNNASSATTIPSIPAPRKKASKKRKLESPSSRRPIEDRVLDFASQQQSALEGAPEQKWMRLNEVLAKMSIERIELMFNTASQLFVGPSENSLLKATYSLVQRVQTHMKEQRNYHTNLAIKMEEQATVHRGEMGRLQDQLQKAQARNEAAKAADKTEMVTSLQKVKKLEVQVRELKAKT
mmetsp:Transcript_22505/g.30124  ORF Transcript_22505/g.30124 Transcript_22505/m.30124 type:complete len:180 (+) Transcript_22505:859-1398(+)|eukprot:CAMPEP_0185597884 /NCGR_PEP_ID=MMETSP0434-20130131/81645_1 /TAXON_ID=626734 ORGANISM="Favella taraikaensis, Strain Fe Narragansett Bay" /NCGR_SAMPLE_ID=MMETSP0434 /ASSEMBLY_ACC=CAM_ASM_000379 /LENGTH=179 /DNA_ID=CAMNT_0028226719 /DNA_START=1319 /DNA_END=1858 /DNA_ORIENTATION=-